MKIKFYTKPFRLTLSIYIACFLLGACSKLGNRYGISPTVDNAPSNNIENPDANIENRDASLSDSTKKLFEAIKHGNLEEVEQLLENDFNDDAFMDLCQTNAYGNTCLHIAAGAENREQPIKAAEIMALLLDKMKPLLLTKEECKIFVDKMRSRILSKFDQKTLFEYSPMEENKEKNNFWPLDRICDNKSKRDSFLKKRLKNIEAKRCNKEKNNFWPLDRICDNKSKRDSFLKLLKNIEAKRCNSDSELIRKNKEEETPIYVAIKYASPGVMNTLLIGTHKFIGLNLHKQTNRSLRAIFEDLMDYQNPSKLQYLVDHYSPTIDSAHKRITWCLKGDDSIFSFPNKYKCKACKIAERIQNDLDKFQFSLENNLKLTMKDSCVQMVLDAVGIRRSQIEQVLVKIIHFPCSNAAASYADADTDTDTTNSSSVRGHIVY